MQYIVVGAGFSGAVSARRLAEAGKRVLVLESRDHVAGNAYDYVNESSILVHQYGPHIFHTDNEEVFNYLSSFTEWIEYKHRVVADVNGKKIPLPFNFNSLKICFGEEADSIMSKLKSDFGSKEKITIHELLKSDDEILSRLGNYIYDNFFLHYSKKQWGEHFEELDPAVLSRVPVNISYEDGYFRDRWQGMPKDGYTKMIENILDHKNIEIKLSTNSDKLISVSDDKILFDNNPYSGNIIYTGPIDELFGYCYGRLPYRTLDFKFETLQQEWYQDYGVVNYTVDKPYTRITEFKHLTGQIIKDATTIVKEYPREFTGELNEIPYYPIASSQGAEFFQRYAELAAKYQNLRLIGRLAEYKYYNMDAVVARALEMTAE